MGHDARNSRCSRHNMRVQCWLLALTCHRSTMLASQQAPQHPQHSRHLNHSPETRYSVPSSTRSIEDGSGASTTLDLCRPTSGHLIDPAAPRSITASSSAATDRHVFCAEQSMRPGDPASRTVRPQIAWDTHRANGRPRYAGNDIDIGYPLLPSSLPHGLQE